MFKMNSKLYYIFLTNLVIVYSYHHLHKRYLIYPEAFILQFTMCLAVPTNIPNRTFNLNLCFQSNFQAPSNVSHYKQPAIIQAKSKHFDFDRMSLYQYTSSLMNDYLPNGDECLLRMICEAAETPLHTNNLFENILHYVLTPSKDKNFINNQDLSKYYEAERKGKWKKKCNIDYKNCDISILDFITRKFIV